MTFSRSIEDYIKAIYELRGAGDRVTSTALAAKLGVTPASVTGMVKRMAHERPDLVDYAPHHGVVLTAEGEAIALRIVRRHRLVELFLCTTLGYSWDEVHEEACKLEHVISEDFEARISKALGDPTRDPHGEMIPTADLTMPSDESLPLASLRIDETATVKRVSDDDPALLRHLDEIGLIPEARVTVMKFSELDGNLTLNVEGQSSNVVLGTAITNRIFVEK